MTLALMLHSFIGVAAFIIGMIWKKITRVKANIVPFLVASVLMFIIAIILDEFDKMLYFEGFGFWMLILSVLPISEILYLQKAYNSSTPERQDAYKQQEAKKSSTSPWIKLLTVLLLIIVVMFALFVTGILRLEITFFLM